jgi:hypothetical protein
VQAAGSNPVDRAAARLGHVGGWWGPSHKKDFLLAF